MTSKPRRAGVIALLAALAGCGGQGQEQQPVPAALPVVTDARDDLVLSWFADGGPRTASAVAEIPAEARRGVRVQDPRIPPEERDSGRVFLADLTRPGADGSYPVRAVTRAEYERTLPRAPEPAAAAPAVAPPPGTDGAARVVMYATAHCPVCQKARRFLLEKGIPYRERDLEKDPGAARDLAAKGQAQGVPVNGVPVFDIGGRLLPGFDADALRRALAVPD
jgi:glutaredoxin